MPQCQTGADCGEGQVDSLPPACSKPEVHKRSADADGHGRLGWLRLESFGFSVIAANGEHCRARRGSGRRLPLALPNNQSFVIWPPQNTFSRGVSGTIVQRVLSGNGIAQVSLR